MRILTPVVLLTILVGCASPWQQFYLPVKALKDTKLSETTSVQIRTVEPERLDAYQKDYNERRANSTVAVEDLTTADRIAETNRLLDALRISGRCPAVRIIGFSEFFYTSPLKTDDGTLAKFAESVGADWVVVSEKYGGKINQIVSMPMTTYSQSTATGNAYGSNGAWATGSAESSGYSTTYVPMQVTRDQYIHQAVFVRKARPGDPPIK